MVTTIPSFHYSITPMGQSRGLEIKEAGNAVVGLTVNEVGDILQTHIHSL